MFGSTTLEVAIGLAFLYFILSLVVSTIRELIEGVMQSRAAHLERGIRELLDDKDGSKLAGTFFEHPLTNSLFRGTYAKAKAQSGKTINGWGGMLYRSTLPAYIPARNFALALFDIASRGAPAAPAPAPAAAAPEMTVNSLRAAIAANIPSSNVQRAILVSLDGVGNDLEKARKNLEAWFDSGMDRVSGWYRKRTQWILLVVGLVVAVVGNIDTLNIVDRLSADSSARALIVAEAQAAVERAKGDPSLAALDCPTSGRHAITCSQKRLEDLHYPIGWRGWELRLPPERCSAEQSKLSVEKRLPACGWHAVRPWLESLHWSSLIGWLLTAAALSLGAPFWFDTLNKIMVIRSTVKPHEKSQEEASEDRQEPTTLLFKQAS